jgi:SAM-dependent methyltransferase
VKLLRTIVPAPVRRLADPVRHHLRYYRYGVGDAFDRLRGRREDLLPPKRLRFMVGGDFREVGQAFLGHLVTLAGLRPDDRVLDVGCGAGRIAVPLTGYLSAAGRYEGFDAWAPGVRWCERNVTPRFPNFRFHRADLYNEFYTPRGKHRASEYRFPYDDASFDVVLLTSVFTHLLPDDMENYLSEVARVLKPGGRCLITYFLLNPETLGRIEAGTSVLAFPYPFGRYRCLSDRGKEAAVAYEEDYIRSLYAENGLAVEPHVERGSWSGVENPATFQDIVVATKE